MKKYFCLLLCLLFTFLFCSCLIDESKIYDNKEQIYTEGYEEIEKMIVDKYGEQVYILYGNKDDKIGFTLFVKESYNQDKKQREETPYYMIVEDTRVLINTYLDQYPNSQLGIDNKSDKVYLEMTVWDGSHYEFPYRITSKDGKLIVYEEVESSSEAMYDYISKTGQDIVYIKIKYDYGLSQEEKEEWKREVIGKFPSLNEGNV